MSITRTKPRYEFSFTAADLRGSTNAFIAAEVKQEAEKKIEAFTYTHDPHTEGWSQLRSDLSRNVQLKHNSSDKKSDFNQCKSADETIKTLQTLLPNEDPKTITALVQHYSQMPSLFAVTPIGAPFLDTEISIEHPEAKNISNEIFFENGVAYIKTTGACYQVIHIETKRRLFPLNESVEILFRLEREKGFVLQHISTNCELIAGIYFGTKKTITKLTDIAKDILREIAEIEKLINSQYLEHEAALKTLTKKLAPKETDKPELKDSEKKTSEKTEKKTEKSKQKADKTYQKKHDKISFVSEANFYFMQFTENKITFAELKKHLNEARQATQTKLFGKPLETSFSHWRFVNKLNKGLTKITEKTSPFHKALEAPTTSSAPTLSLTMGDKT